MSTAPAELAALVAREVDEGVASALSALDAGGALVLDSIVARVAAPAAGARARSWDDVTWAAEMVLRVDPAGARARVVADGGVHAQPRIPRIIAALPVSAIRGIGTHWTARLTRESVTTIGALATLGPARLTTWSAAWGSDALALAARARGCAVSLPRSLVTLAADRSILDLARTDPTTLPGDSLERTALWQAALTLTAAIDAKVLHGIPARRLAE